MRRIALIILLIIPFVASAQRMEIYTYNSFNYIALYAYGLPRDIVKTNSEMRASQNNRDGTGVVRRHHTTKGINERIGDDGYNVNEKLSFAFMVAPHNITKEGEHAYTSSDVMTWSEASGWDTSIDTNTSEQYDTTTGIGTGSSTLASTPTGCAAYKGMHGTDSEGDWRLPTQREMQVMFTVIEQALGYIASGEIESELVDGVYWTSTEFYPSPAAWSVDTFTGRPEDEEKYKERMVRCVKDIYESIND